MNMYQRDLNKVAKDYREFALSIGNDISFGLARKRMRWEHNINKERNNYRL